MFGFLRRWLGIARRKRRAIFRYFDGSKTRWADPFEVQRELERHGGKNWIAKLDGLKVANGGKLDQLSPAVRQSAADVFHASVKEVASLARLAFHVPYFHSDDKPVGLTDAESIDLLGQFFAFLGELEDEFYPLLLPPVVEPQPSADGSAIEPYAVSPEPESESGESDVKSSEGMWPPESASLSENKTTFDESADPNLCPVDGYARQSE